MFEFFFDLFTPYAVRVGLSCLAAQCILTLFLSTNGFGLLKGGRPWTETPAFTAHQMITFPVLLYLTMEGMREWIYNEEEPTALDRMLGPRHGHLSEFVLGMMAFWDIPTGLTVPSLCDTAMIIHHFGMFGTAALAMGILSDGRPILGYYAPFYFGLIELSSLPLIIVDLFHPKHKEWHDYLASDEAPSWLKPLNEVARIVFAVCFLGMRTFYFPYVSFFGVLPDVWTVTSLPPEENVPVVALTTMATFNILFSCLQLYWGGLVIRQIIKLLQGTPKKKKE